MKDAATKSIICVLGPHGEIDRDRYPCRGCPHEVVNKIAASIFGERPEGPRRDGWKGWRVEAYDADRPSKRLASTPVDCFEGLDW